MSGWIRTLVNGLCAAVALLFAAPAFAAFPGRDGILAVQPRFGRGIVLVRPDGLGPHRICRSCGAPVRPSWSPDGRELVFAGPAIRIVYPDGSCLNCQFGVARDPVFEPSGALISFLAGGTLTVDGIDGNRQAAPTVLRGVGEAAWARGGLLAVVRHGVIWAGRPGHLRRFGAGTQISWAPGGGSIAAVRQGWVVIIRVSDGHLTRLVRGSAPAFSPDGRWIAFVSPGHRLMIVRVGSAPAAPRFVGNVQAVSIDWQPKPRRLVPACAVPSGWTVMASSAGGVVTGDGQLGALDFSNAAPLAYMGCLRATGRWRLLERFTTNNVDSAFSVLSAALAPPYTGLVLASQDEHYGGYSNTLQVFDLRTGTLDPHLGGESTNCDEYSGPPGPCAVFDHVVLGSDGVSAAHAGFEAPVGWGSLSIGRLSCAPASTTCVAVDGDLNQFSSASPGAWTKTSFAAIGAPYEIACPSATLCVGVGGEIFTTTDPGGGASTWNQTALAGGPHSFNAISCPTVSLCVVTDVAGTVTTSTDPTGGAGAWSTAGLGHHLGSVICSAAPLCFASAFDGTVLSSSDPAGGASTWVVSLGTPAFNAGSCPTSSLCVAVNGTHLYTSTDPAAGVWTQHTPGGQLYDASCASASLCVAVGSGGALDVSTDPAGGAWTTSTIDSGRTLLSVSCPSASLCVATDMTGHVVTSSNPTAGPSAWTPTLVDGDPCADTTPCSVEQIQVSDRGGSRVVDSFEKSGAGPFLTGLALTGDMLSWNHDGSPRSLTLTP